MYRKAFALALVPLAAAACDGSTGPNAREQVAIRFATAGGASLASGASFAHAGSDALVLQDGTVITDVRLIVSEFELERAEGACLDGQDDDDCEKFEALPSLLDLPLGGGAVTVATDLVPEGSYTALEFEVEDLDLDDVEDRDDEDADDAAKRQAIASIGTTLRGLYPQFPEAASMVVHGRSAAGTEFTVYFDAEIEVEVEFADPFTVPGATALTVNVDPAAWFQGLSLPALNGRTVEFEFEAEFESGFEDDDDDGEDDDD